VAPTGPPRPAKAGAKSPTGKPSAGKSPPTKKKPATGKKKAPTAAPGARRKGGGKRKRPSKPSKGAA
jgi:hypothetical protein